MLKEEISRDLERAKEALESAKRNLVEGDIFTAANRAFVACENAVYVILKSHFGSSSISRQRILTRLGEIKPEAKELYDRAYDLRVQADYGRKTAFLSLTKENLELVINKVESLVKEAEALG